MQMLNAESQERFYKEQKEEWDKIPFTSTAINEQFGKYRHFALMFDTPVALNVIPAYFVNLMCNPMDAYCVSDIVTLCQSFEKRTFFEYMQSFGRTPDAQQGYADFLSCMEQLTNEVNDIVEPIKDKLIRKMLKLQGLGHGKPMAIA